MRDIMPLSEVMMDHALDVTDDRTASLLIQGAATIERLEAELAKRHEENRVIADALTSSRLFQPVRPHMTTADDLRFLAILCDQYDDDNGITKDDRLSVQDCLRRAADEWETMAQGFSLGADC